jgi:hypothetical protein
VYVRRRFHAVLESARSGVSVSLGDPSGTTFRWSGRFEFSGFRQFRRVAQRGRFHVIFVFIGEPQFQQFSVARRSRQRRGATPNAFHQIGTHKSGIHREAFRAGKKRFSLLSPPSFQEAGAG